MKAFFAVQLALLLTTSVALGGMMVGTEIYSDVHSRIVKVLCLSCIKLEPKTSATFTFKTATGGQHPEFITENLSRGPVFLFYSEDVCAGCEVMYPVIKGLLGVTFEKGDQFWQQLMFHDTPLTFIYVNIDHTTPSLRQTLELYDKDHVGGLPQMTVVTLGYDDGTVRPYYTSVYGTLGVPTDAERATVLETLLHEAGELYSENRQGYQP